MDNQATQRPLTTGEIAQYCHVSHRAVLKWVAGGKLPAYRTPGNHSRVKVEDFIRFLQEYKMPIPAEIQGQSTKKKILIVDDDKGIVHSLKRILMLENKYIIEEAYDGFEAGRKFSSFKPDFIILDIHMPGLDGHQVCATIRRDMNNAKVKILVISATHDENEIKKIKDLGADDYLEKPFSNEALKEKIGRLVG
jgi:two-component system, OmpR family, response regulator VicR